MTKADAIEILSDLIFDQKVSGISRQIIGLSSKEHRSENNKYFEALKQSIADEYSSEKENIKKHIVKGVKDGIV